MREPVIVTPPAEEPVSLDEARLHLAIDEDLTQDNPLIADLIVAARQTCELHLSRALVTQTLDAFLDDWPATGVWWDRGRITLPRPPLQSVTSVTYTDGTGATQTWPAPSYQVITGTPGIVLPVYGGSWPTGRRYPNAIRIRFVAGYGAAAAVPRCVKQAMLLLIGHGYRNREATVNTGAQPVKLPWSVESLLDSERWEVYA